MVGDSDTSNKNLRYASKLARYILFHKKRYVSLRSTRYDINPFSRAEGTYRAEGISHREIYRKSVRIYIAVAKPHHSAFRIPNSEFK